MRRSGKSYATLNITAREIRLLSADRKGVQYWSSEELPSGWLKDGHILEPEGVGAAIRSLFESAGIPRSDVIICVTGLPFTYRMVKLPFMKQGMVRGSIRHFMSKEMSIPAEQMCLSWATIDESDGEVTYLVLGVDQEIADAIARTMKEARIRRWTMDLKSLALARAASQADALIVSMESDCYDIILVYDGNVSTIHTVSIEDGVLSPIEHAEQLVVELSKTVTYDARKHGGRLPGQYTPLLLTGEISGNEGVRDLIQTELGYPVKPLTPLLTLQNSLPVHLYSTNMGLALKYTSDLEIVPQEGNSYSDIDLDILSGRYARPRKRFPVISLLVPLILAITIGFVPPIQQASIEHDAENLRLQNELDMVNRQLQEVRLYEEKAGQIQSEIDYVYRQLEAVQKGRQALFGNQGGFGDDLVKVVNALPLESCFTSIKLLPEQILVTGSADNAFQVIDFTTNLKQSGFSSNIRTSAIRETSDMDGVTFEVIIAR